MARSTASIFATRLAIMLGILVLCSACASRVGKKMTALSVGMSKEQVIEVMGKPTSVTASDGTETLYYSLTANRAVWTWDWEEYYVTLKSGKVTGYGRSEERAQTDSQAKDQEASAH